MAHIACTRCTEAISTWYREEMGVVVVGVAMVIVVVSDRGVKKEVECSSSNEQKTKGALKRNGTQSIKSGRTDNASDVCRKAMRQTEQQNAAEQ